MADRPKSLLQWARDLVVYAPVGLAVVAVEELPDLVTRGRERAERQMATAAMVGKFAVSQGQRETQRLVSSATERVRKPSRPATPERPPTSPTPPPPSSTASQASPAPAHAASGKVVKPGEVDQPLHPGLTTSLAIPGYDSLSASQVVQRLPGLTSTELEAVRIHEASHRGRKTILNRVAQLQAGT